ncbi:MAG TPA: helix-turn-helix domain-containing protein [Rhizomicrobium sp.]|jgi:transcriptional regulator with XRE-family HTH domain|nr:helix-turn-helix domain-containing protein [Rhizomicrobium sp.]
MDQSKMPIQSSQCRAARALLGWSQDDLEVSARVSKKTIADFERNANIPYDKTLREIQFALEAGGVQFIPENGGGAGVRLKVAAPRLLRRRVSRFDRMATMAVAYKDREFQLRLSTNILDDIDRTNHGSDADFEKSMDDHLNLILITAAAAIDTPDGHRVDDNGVVLLTNDDFDEYTGPRRRLSARFVVGQRFIGKSPPHRRAEIVQIADDGRKAWVDVRTSDGLLIDSAWVTFAQFNQHWSLA